MQQFQIILISLFKAWCLNNVNVSYEKYIRMSKPGSKMLFLSKFTMNDAWKCKFLLVKMSYSSKHRVEKVNDRTTLSFG